MVQYTRRSVIDFSSYITERAKGLTGREWVFQEVNGWLANPDRSRYFLLTGEPGSGKTAIASRLVQFSQGSVAPPAGLTYLTPHFLSALHFCLARDSRWINPHVFAKSLALQLADRYPNYAQALAEKSGDRQIRIEVKQHIDQGPATGVVINQLDVSGIAPEDAFNRVVREPLEALFHDVFDQQVVILIDALDEALDYSGIVGIVSLLAQLDKLPTGVRFVLTTRQDSRVEHAFLDADVLELSAAKYEQCNQDDIHRYVNDRLTDDRTLAGRVVQLELSHIAKLIEIVPDKAEGNFLYARFLLDAIIKGQHPLAELGGLPEGLDGLYFESLQRVVKFGKGDWYNEYAPLIGVLSVAQEGLTLAQLQAFTKQSEGTVWKNLGDLQQFIEEIDTKDGMASQDVSYRLYHRSVTEFLHRQSLVVKKRQLRNSFYLPARAWHKTVAVECERGNLAIIWEDVKRDPIEQARREYARKYYISHLYRAQEWQQLFEVLDTVQYGWAKVRYDLSTYSYAQDLDLGRQAAIWDGWTFEEGIALLPRLWQYTLLRCRLRSRADQYPEKAFSLLVLLKRERDALRLAELLTDPVSRMRALLQIAEQVREQANQEAEWLEVLLRACEVAQSIENSTELIRLVSVLVQAQQWERAEAVIHLIGDSGERAKALGGLASALAQAQQWERAEAVIHLIGDSGERSAALTDLARILVQAQQWERAEGVIRSIDNNYQRAGALSLLARALAQAQQWERTELLWAEVQAAICSIDNNTERAEVLSIWMWTLAQAQQWERAEAVWTEAEATLRSVKDSTERAASALSAVGLSKLARELAQAQQWDRASALWAEAEAAIRSIENDIERGAALSILVEELAQAQQWERAEAVIRMIDDNIERAKALGDLASALAQAQQWERAEAVWTEAEALIRSTKDDRWQGAESKKAWERAWWNLVTVLTQAQQWEQAEAVILIIGSEWDHYRNSALGFLVQTLVQAQQWERAEAAVQMIKSGMARSHALRELGSALAQAQQWERAEAAWTEAEAAIRTILGNVTEAEHLSALAWSLAQAQQWERAEAVIDKIELLDKRTEALCTLAWLLVQARQLEKAEAVWREAQAVIGIREQEATSIFEKGVVALRALTAALAQAEQWAEAEATCRMIDDSGERTVALSILAAALAQAQQWERASALWVEAEATCRMIDDSGERTVALSILAAALAQAQQWERAEAVIDTIENLSRMPLQATVERELARMFAQAQQWERAEAVIDKIELLDKRAEALRELGNALAQAMQLERAKAVWTEAETTSRLIEDDMARAKALRELGSALAQAMQLERAKALWTEAEAIIHTIDITFWQEWVLNSLAQELVEMKDWERAKEVVSWRDNNTLREVALEGLARVLAQAQQWEHAEAVIRSIEDHETQAGALSLLVWALARAQQWERAETTIRSVDNKIVRERTLNLLERALIRAQQWERAEALWAEVQATCRLIENKIERAAALSLLAWALAQAQQWERAEALWAEVQAVIHSIEDNHERGLNLFGLAWALQWEEMLWNEHAETMIGEVWPSISESGPTEMIFPIANLASMTTMRGVEAMSIAEIAADLSLIKQALLLPQVKYWKHVEDDIHSIMYTRAKTLREPGNTSTQAQQWMEELWTEIEAALLSIEDSMMRAIMLSSFIALLLQAQQWERARAISYMIEDDSMRIAVLWGLATRMAAAGENEGLLHSVQHLCWLAKTRTEAFLIFIMAITLIPHYPELNLALFYEAFTWVDTFFKGEREI